MKSSFGVATLSLATGIFSVSFFPELPKVSLLLVVGVVGLTLLFLKRWILACLLLGLVYGCVWGMWLMNNAFPKAVDNQRFQISGVVTGLPRVERDRIRFQLRLNEIGPIDHHLKAGSVNHWKQKYTGRVVQLVLYTRSLKEDNIEITPGQVWSFSAKLRRPRGFVNPGGFDYQLFLHQQRIWATGYVLANKKPPVLLGRECHKVWVSCWRYELTSRLKNTDIEGDKTALMSGLLIGDRQFISSDHWNLLKQTGTVHLLAISGLHVGFAAVIGALLGRLLARLIQLGAYQQRYWRWCEPVLSLVFGVIYSLLAGLTLPTLRALVMVTVYALYRLSYRPIHAGRALGFALVIVALIDPLAARSASFWLSFVAVAVLLFGFVGYHSKNSYRSSPQNDSLDQTDSKGGLDRSRFGLIAQPVYGYLQRGVRGLFKAQWIVTLGLLVPGVAFIQGVSVLAPLANIFAVPWVTLTTIPSLFLGAAFLDWLPQVSHLFWQITSSSLSILLIYLEYLVSVYSGFISIGYPGVWVLLCTLIGVLWLLAPRGAGVSYLAALLMLMVFLKIPSNPLISITFLDVGQGTAVVVETEQHVLVYDTGRRFSDQFDAGRDIVLPYLNRQGVRHVDTLIVSHSDGDHAGGAKGLVEGISVGQILSGQSVDVTSRACQSGQSWRWGKVSFEILWPLEDNTEVENKVAGSFRQSDNNASCVVLVSVADQQLLLTGDIESDVESILIRSGATSATQLSEIDILLAPHHGSKTSSSENWVAHLLPDYVVFTAGYQNPYRHPHSDVEKRYRGIQSEVLNTATSGAVRFVLEDEQSGWRVIRERVNHRRYWYDN